MDIMDKENYDLKDMNNDFNNDINKDINIEDLAKMLTEVASSKPAEPPCVETTIDNSKKVYTVPEIQDILGVGACAVRSLLKRNEVHAVKIGQKYYISKKSFDEWLGM